MSTPELEDLDTDSLPREVEGPSWKRNPDGTFAMPQYSLGKQCAVWAYTHLVDGDGNPWTFTREQYRILSWFMAVNERGEFVYRDHVLLRLKGGGKDPFSAVLATIFLCGPSMFAGWKRGKDGKPVPYGVPNPKARIQIAAVSRDQNRTTLQWFPRVIPKRTEEKFNLELNKEVIYANGGAQRIEVITSSFRSAEGADPTLVITSEIHHWTPSNGGIEMDAVIRRNLGKVGGRRLAITNMFQTGEGSVMEEAWNAWQRIKAAGTEADGFVVDMLAAPADTDLADEDSLRRALLACRGDSTWVPIDNIIKEIRDPRTTPSQARRFYLSQQSVADDAYMAQHEWDAIRTDDGLSPGDEICLGMDGSVSDDWTALVAIRVKDGLIQPLKTWAPDPNVEEWEVPRMDVDAHVGFAFSTYRVVGFFGDRAYWESYQDQWAVTYGKDLKVKAQGARHPIAFDMRHRVRDFAEAVEAFLDAVVTGQIKHNGDPFLHQCALNARRRPTKYGLYSVFKASPDSPYKIDTLIAAILAFEARRQYLTKGRQVRRGAIRLA